MKLFWTWYVWLAAAWTAYLISVGEAAIPTGLLGCAVFMACYFLSDLFHRKPFIYYITLTSALASAVFSSILIGNQSEDEFAVIFLLLLGSYLSIRSVNFQPALWSTLFGGTAALLLITVLLIEQRWMQAVFAGLYMIAYTIILVIYRTTLIERNDTNARFEALLDEFRNLKRSVKTQEDVARNEERTYIARRIHDSVGHKLTSLLMQIEMFRMQAEGPHKSLAEQMKSLAQESLHETRSAVKTLQEEEVGGIQALLRLIRNLESESYMQVEFVVRYGALSVLLNQNQSIAVYRAIQEALTNAMRHGANRRLNIMLEAPGGSVFRFEVSNEIKQSTMRFREGFGLNAMRDRVKQAGGNLDIQQTDSRFIVRGSFQLHTQ